MGPGHRGGSTGWSWWEARGRDKAAPGHAYLPESEEVARPQLQVPDSQQAKGQALAHLGPPKLQAAGGWAGHQLMEESCQGGYSCVSHGAPLAGLLPPNHTYPALQAGFWALL